MPESHLYLKDQIQVYKVQLMHSPTPLGKEPQKDLCHDGVIEDIIIWHGGFTKPHPWWIVKTSVG
jgi:hypothetical protein